MSLSRYFTEIMSRLLNVIYKKTLTFLITNFLHFLNLNLYVILKPRTNPANFPKHTFRCIQKNEEES